MTTTKTFAAQYAALQALATNVAGACIPSYVELKKSIRGILEADSAAVGRQRMLGFVDFESFFIWLDTISAYDQHNADAASYKPFLAVVYGALRAYYQRQETFAAEFAVVRNKVLDSNGDTFMDFDTFMSDSLRPYFEIEGSENEGTRADLLSLADDGVEAFFEWWDVVNAFDNNEEPEVTIDVKPFLEVAFKALLDDYREFTQDHDLCASMPDATRQVLLTLQGMHPELRWSVLELGDYDQFADADAPQILIGFDASFNTDLGPMIDPYSNTYGSPAEPSLWGLTDEAAELLRLHNKVHLTHLND